MDKSDGSTGRDALAIPFDLATPLGRDLAAVDWAATGLGPWQAWPVSLLNTVRLMTASRFSMWMAWGPELTFFCNDAYRRDTLGAKYPWALGKPSDQVWSEIWPDIGPLIESVIRTGTATWDERMQLFLERSGYREETYHTFSYSPIHGDGGEIAGMLCVVSEDTARVISERRMGLLRDLGAALSGAATVDEVGAAAQRQIGRDPYDLPFALAYLFDDVSTAHLHWVSGLALGQPAATSLISATDTNALWHDALFGDRETTHVTDLSEISDLPTGGWDVPPTQALSVPLRHLAAIEPYGYLIVGLNPLRKLDYDYSGFVDLVGGQLAAAIARARAFENERDRVEKLAELDRAKTTFFTNVSHELRTPLTLLLGPAEDALRDQRHPLDERQRERVEVIERNGERLLKLVNTLLDFSRLESGRIEASFEQLDLSRYTIELASMFESAYNRCGLTLSVDVERLSDRPYIDREMWAKIVLNLLSNALKATFVGGVTVRLCDTGTGALLEVTDTGIGIPNAQQARLFERFHRVTGADLRTHEGSGIGLALVAELARLHGGDVTVQSRPGVGSTFRVRIPYGRDHLDEGHVRTGVSDEPPDVTRYGAGYLAEALRWVGDDTSTGIGAETAESARGDLPRVIVVDDNADMREYVRDLLADSYAITTAQNGAEALGLIRENLPDLVLTDVMMPVLDGFGLLAAIRADPQTAHVPVVMLSARSGDEATIEGLEAGADDYLIKPFAARELLARVRANLELDRVRQLVSEFERTRSLLDHAESLAHVGSWEVDVGRNSVRMSSEMSRIMGLSPREVVTYDTAISQAIPADAALFDQVVHDAIERNEPFDVVIRAQRPDGGSYLARVRGTVLLDDANHLAYIRGSTQDITEQHANEVAIARAEAEREVAAREHSIATELQQSLLPPPSFEADQLEIAAFYRPGVEGTQVGGDWHDVIDLGDGRTAVVIGDVMGRGVRAAAVMGQLRAAVRAYARLDLAPAHLIRLLDDTVREIIEDTIVTVVYAVYDPDEQTLVYANAGHLPPLVVEPGRQARRLLAGGPPLGAGQHGEISETVPLPTGTMLVLYTDGLVEKRGSDLDAGIDRLAGLAATSQVALGDLPAELVDGMLPDGPDDDVAILVCRANDESAEHDVSRHDVDGGPGALIQARRFVSRTLDAWQISEALAFDIVLCVSELTTNAINHGARPIQLRLRKQRHHLLLEVRDSGKGVPSMRLSEPDEASGRGLLIVARVSEHWGIRSGPAGKTVWAQFRLPSAETDSTSIAESAG